MNLLSVGVGVHRINNVISYVAQLCGKTVENLPSISTINRISDQRVSVSYMQVHDILGEQKNTCLQSDETRKHGQCYEVFAVRDNDEKEWVLGLRDMLNKGSQTCLDTLKTIVGDISESTQTDVGRKIISQIKNTMSDRAATEQKFHTLLKSYRNEILPSIYDSWNELCLEEQESISTMNNFYCGLHILVNFADLSATVVRRFEESMKEGSLGAEAHSETSQFTKAEESGSVRLLRTACKCLARGCDEKSGCYGDFKTFMDQKDEDEGQKHRKGSLLVPFRGNRFNILFYNAEIVFFLAEYIKEFFEKVCKPTNRLQKGVLYDIREDLYLAVTKALGLCSKLVTAPFWRRLEQKDCSLEDASSLYQKLYLFLEKAKDDNTEVICGTLVPFEEYIKKDAVYERLITKDSFDEMTYCTSANICSLVLSLLIKSASDHLPGGKYATVNEELARTTQSVPRHNKFPERVFGLLDALTRYRPVASALCNESYIMFSLNKTGEWLQSLSIEEKTAYLDMSRKDGRDVRMKYIKRIKELQKSRRETLKEKRIELERKEHAQYLKKEELANDILFYGLWQYPDMVDTQLQTIKSVTEKKKALKIQLNFRKNVLEQKYPDKTVFQVSGKGKAYTVGELTANLKKLISSALDIQRKNPEESGLNLIGKRIRHYFMVDGVRTQYRGRVVSTVPGYPEWFNVVYDGDIAIYVYKLREDYSVGDLELIVDEGNKTKIMINIFELNCLSEVFIMPKLFIFTRSIPNFIVHVIQF